MRMSNDTYWSCAQTLAWICARQEPTEFLRTEDTLSGLVVELGFIAPLQELPSVELAMNELLRALRRGAMSCTADHLGTVYSVPQSDWALMKICPGVDGFYARNEKYNSPNDTKYKRLHFRDSVVRKLWPATSGGKSQKRGRRPEYDWPSFHSEVTRILEDEGDFDPTVDPAWKQATLESRMRQWCDLNWTKTPVESTARAHIKKALQSYRESRAGK
jgi:hypothetical protein